MKVVNIEIIDSFIKKHADIKDQICAWLYEIKEAEWKTPHDIKKRYSSASFKGNNRVIFNIKGNKYRIEAKISYHMNIVFIKRIGTHAEYSKWRD
ncbi:type II toxin-antitoxin system HigB family toxin [bacterium]